MLGNRFQLRNALWDRPWASAQRRGREGRSRALGPKQVLARALLELERRSGGKIR